MADLLTFSTQWKDFFWIIFTLVATGTSVLTYARVRKSIKFNILGHLTVLDENSIYLTNCIMMQDGRCFIPIRLQNPENKL